MSERYDREEELRRRSEERRTSNPYPDEGRYGSTGRGSDSQSGGFSDATERVSRAAGRVLGGGSGRQSGTGRGQESGLYGSSIDSSNVVGAAVAELIGTFILIFTGCAVAVAAILQRPTAGPIYDSLAVALAFGIALVVIVAAIGHVSGRT